MVHLYIGNGKGKTTAAIGLALRAWGFGRKVYIGEFLKDSHWPAGEIKAARKISLRGFRIERFRNQVHPIFRKNKYDPQGLKESIKKSLKKVAMLIEERKFDVMVLDELLNCIQSRLLKNEEVVNLIKRAKEKDIELVITGRDASEQLKKIADYVSFIKEIKHPYRRGILAREGIDY